VSNNFAEAYALWQGIRLAMAKGIQKIIILGDPILMIRAIINQTDIGTKVHPGVISRALNLLAEFEYYSVYHIRHQHNNEADKWAKYGSTLGGEIVINGGRDILHIP
jgi:ribonuclease HI